jgi:hypothetical protein
MIFGVQAPKFVYSSTTYNLDYVNVNPTFIDGDFIEHVSVITGKRFYILKGNYAEFTITMNLWKYTSPTPKAKFQELLGFYQNQYGVEFFPHRDAPSIKNSSNAVVLFRITNLEPFYLETAQYRDVLNITFKSTGFIDPTKNLL